MKNSSTVKHPRNAIFGKTKLIVADKIKAKLSAMDNLKMKKYYTRNQTMLAQHKNHLQESLGEVKQEMIDILRHLKDEDNTLDLLCIQQIAKIIPKLTANLNIAIADYSAYGEVRQRLISFADEDDIHFITHYIHSILSSTEGISQQILEMIKTEKQHLRYAKTHDQLDVAIEALHEIKCYINQVEQQIETIQQQYTTLLEKIYHCSIEELAQRFNIEYNETITETYQGIYQDIEEDTNHPDQSQQEPLYKTFAPANDLFSKTKIDSMQQAVARALSREIPEFRYDDFFGPAETIATKIVHFQLDHNKTNQLFAGYSLLQELEDQKISLTPLKTLQKKRGPKSNNLFDQIDQNMLREVFTSLKQEEQSSIKSVNTFSALFLVAMANGAIDKIDRAVATFTKMIQKVCKSYNFCYKWIRKTVSDYITIFHKKNRTEHEQRLFQLWQTIVSRMIPILKKNHLLLQL